MECMINTIDSLQDKTKYNCSVNNSPEYSSTSDLKNVYKQEKTDNTISKTEEIRLKETTIIELKRLIDDKLNSNDLVQQIKPKHFLSVDTLWKICVWYFFSFLAIFLSKRVIQSHSVDLLFFTGIQLAVSTTLSALDKFLNHRDSSDRALLTHPFIFSMAFIGLMRAIVIFLGLLSIKFVAISFMETVKSSAPLFTLIISFFILREKSGFLVQLSLCPIMLGLTLCTAFETSFDWLGFLAALGANLAECLQFVLSKVYLGGNRHKVDPSDFQLYSSVSALLSVFIFFPFLCDIQHLTTHTSVNTTTLMLIVAFSYYMQSLMSWYLMELLSAVTHSICNTIKCGLVVWLSILLFGNEVTFWSGLGSFLVIAGVGLYQKARSIEKDLRVVVRERVGEVDDSLRDREVADVKVDADTAERLTLVGDLVDTKALGSGLNQPSLSGVI